MTLILSPTWGLKIVIIFPYSQVNCGPDILARCSAEDSSPDCLRCGGGGCPPSSSPSSGRPTPARPRSRDTGSEHPWWRSLSLPPSPAVLPRSPPTRDDRFGTQSYHGLHPCFGQRGFCGGWTRWAWCRCCWSNLLGSTRGKTRVTLLCAWEPSWVVPIWELLLRVSWCSASSKHHCSRHWDICTSSCTLENNSSDLEVPGKQTPPVINNLIKITINRFILNYLQHMVRKLGGLNHHFTVLSMLFSLHWLQCPLNQSQWTPPETDPGCLDHWWDYLDSDLVWISNSPEKVSKMMGCSWGQWYQYPICWSLHSAAPLTVSRSSCLISELLAGSSLDTVLCPSHTSALASSVCLCVDFVVVNW